ncbi:hypothetical protein E4U41_000431 [Claviceps citrina]|nr:hypothetical protein E4U41_000431 [Claviceps citrina]
MPIGIQRLNAKRSQPNPNIIFIKALPGPDEKTAQAFLERIAAQCLPVMRKNHISVMTLEEYEPNREFVGRNFNAGEVVQLVLRSGRSGRWLPFEYVQMVMMHELAHCKEMNHSRAFWAVRNQYAAQMDDLWREGYTGEGIWGRGADLATGEWERNTVQPGEEVLPEHLCGGTYRSRRPRRKRKATARALSYQERKQRRILNKFGENGVALGADEDTKVKLERGKKVLAKPRVAGSARGRELRAAAALARFEQNKVAEMEEKEENSSSSREVKKEEEMESGSSESGSEYEEGSPDAADSHEHDAVDVNGTRMLDRQGRGMVKVCEKDDEDAHGADARTELSQLQGMLNGHDARLRRGTAHGGPSSKPILAGVCIKGEDDEPSEGVAAAAAAAAAPPSTASIDRAPLINKDENEARADPRRAVQRTTMEPSSPWTCCSMCSFENDGTAATCGVCSHVLKPALAPNSWICADEQCKSSGYVNSGDCGVCGLCGGRRHSR